MSRFKYIIFKFSDTCEIKRTAVIFKSLFGQTDACDTYQYRAWRTLTRCDMRPRFPLISCLNEVHHIKFSRMKNVLQIKCLI